MRRGDSTLSDGDFIDASIATVQAAAEYLCDETNKIASDKPTPDVEQDCEGRLGELFPLAMTVKTYTHLHTAVYTNIAFSSDMTFEISIFLWCFSIDFAFLHTYTYIQSLAYGRNKIL